MNKNLSLCVIRSNNHVCSLYNLFWKIYFFELFSHFGWYLTWRWQVSDISEIKIQKIHIRIDVKLKVFTWFGSSRCGKICLKYCSINVIFEPECPSKPYVPHFLYDFLHCTNAYKPELIQMAMYEWKNTFESSFIKKEPYKILTS